MQTKIVFTELNDGLNCVIGEKTFDDTTVKDEIEVFIEQAVEIYKQTRNKRISYIIHQRKSEKEEWIIPLNPKTLRNELI